MPDRPAGCPVSVPALGRRFLVTGARGFLGRHLCRRLVAGGAEVWAVSRFADTDDEPLHWRQCDCEDLEAVRALADEAKPEVIVHLGGLVSATPELGLVLPTFHSLLTTTVNLLTVGTELGCQRILLAGSLEESLGPGDAAVSPYGAAKGAASAYGRMFHALYGTPVVVVRPYMAYGPGQHPTKLIPYTVLSLLSGRPPRVSSGGRRLDWVYVDDVIEGMVRAACAPGLEGTTLELGSGRLTSVREVVERITEMVNPAVRPEFGGEPDRPQSPPRTADVEGSQRAIGWRPMVELARGLQLTVAWFRERSLSGRPAASGQGGTR